MLSPHPEIFFDIGRPVIGTYSPNVVGEIFIPKCIFEATHLLSSPWQCIPLMFFAMELKERNKGRRSMIVFPQNFLKSVNLMDRLGISPIYKFWPFLSQQESPSVLWTNEFWECPEHCVLIVTLRDTSMRLYENKLIEKLFWWTRHFSFHFDPNTFNMKVTQQVIQEGLQQQRISDDQIGRTMSNLCR